MSMKLNVCRWSHDPVIISSLGKKKQLSSGTIRVDCNLKKARDLMAKKKNQRGFSIPNSGLLISQFRTLLMHASLQKQKLNAPTCNTSSCQFEGKQ